MLTRTQQVVLDMLGLPGAEGHIDVSGRIAIYVPFVVNGEQRKERKAVAPATFAVLVRAGLIYRCPILRTFSLPGPWIRNLHELASHVGSAGAATRGDRIANLAAKTGVRDIDPIRYGSRIVGLVLAKTVNVQFPIRAAAWASAVKRAQVSQAVADTSPRT